MADDGGSSSDQVSQVINNLGDGFENAVLDLCDNRFRSEAWNELLKLDDTFGFIVMNRGGALFGTLSGNTREVLHNFTMDLSRRRGRYSKLTALPDGLRMVKILGYVRKAVELATYYYIDPATNQPNVSGLVLAGSADFETELTQLSRSDIYMLDPRLQAKILTVVKLAEVPYGRDNGFSEAILLSMDILVDARWILEKRLLGKLFHEINSQDTGKYVLGFDDTLKALEMGVLETLIVWESLETNQYLLKNAVTGELMIKHLSKEQEVDQSNFKDAKTGAELEVQDKVLLLEWFKDKYKHFGYTLEKESGFAELLEVL